MKNAVDYLHINPVPYVPQYSQLAAHYLVGYLQQQGKIGAIISATHQLLSSTLGGDSPEILHQLKQNISCYSDFLNYVQAKQRLADMIAQNYTTMREQLTYSHNHLKVFTKGEVETFAGLLSLLQNPEQSVFYPYLHNVLLTDILQYNPKVLGITVGDKWQLPFSFALLGVLKQSAPNIKCGIGGYLPSVCARDIWLHKDEKEIGMLFEYLDFIIHNEGEIPLLKYLNYVDGHTDIRHVPQLIYKEHTQMRSNSLDENGWVKEEKMSQLTPSEIPTPHFIAQYLEQQLMPSGGVVSLLTRRGCSHHCSYCAIDKGYNRGAINVSKMATQSVADSSTAYHSHLATNPHQIVNDIEQYVAQGIQVFSIVDETFAPVAIEQICHQLDEKQISGCKFEYYTTCHPKFLDKSFCEKISRHGFIFPQFGLETLSQKALQTTQKYQNLTTLSQQSTILQNCWEAGIMPHVFLMIGLPDQTSIDLLHMLTFLHQHGNHILTIKPTTTKIAKYSEDAIRPEKIGITLGESKPFAANIPFQRNEHSSINRISKKSALAWKIVFETRIALKHQYNVFTKHVPYVARLTVEKNLLEDIVDQANTDSTNSLSQKLDGDLAELGESKILRAFSHVIKDLLSEYRDKPNRLLPITSSMIMLIKGLQIGNPSQTRELLNKQMQGNLTQVDQILHQCDIFPMTDEHPFYHLLDLLEKAGREMS